MRAETDEEVGHDASLDNVKSHGLWEVTAPPPSETAELLGSIKVDTAIVGGGYPVCGENQSQPRSALNNFC